MLDRKSPPPYTPNSVFNLLQPEQVILSNGANAFFVHGGDQEVVKLELIFSAGRWFEDFPGLSYFASHLLAKGTRTKNSYQIAQALESSGIHLEVTPGYDFVSVSLFGLNKRIPDVLSILLEICSSPVYPVDELLRTKNILLQNLKVNREKTSYLAATAFREHLFGKDHPYGSEVSEDHLGKIQTEALLTFHKSFFTHFVCFVTGKIADTLTRNIVETLNRLSFHRMPVKSIQNLSPDGGAVKIEKPGSVQTSLRLGKHVIPRNHPEYPGLILANHALGGYFGSRLMQSLREDKALTYGIHSAIHPLRHNTYFAISTDVNKEQVDFAIGEIYSELRKFRSIPMENNELQVVKNHFLGSLFTEINTPFAHTEKLKNIYLNELDSGYYQNFINKIQHLSSIKLIELAEKYFHEDDLFIVSAG
jgi:zinc protease